MCVCVYAACTCTCEGEGLMICPPSATSRQWPCLPRCSPDSGRFVLLSPPPPLSLQLRSSLSPDISWTGVLLPISLSPRRAEEGAGEIQSWSDASQVGGMPRVKARVFRRFQALARHFSYSFSPLESSRQPHGGGLLRTPPERKKLGLRG